MFFQKGERLLTKAEMKEHTIQISELLSLRLYKDTRPYSHHIADLQKGLILVYRGAELVGEGTGFGMPVVRYQDKTYFSGSSTMQTFQEGDCTTAIKQFVLDIVSEKRLRKTKIENKILHKFATHMAELYQRKRHWRVLTIKNLSKRMGVQTNFARVKPTGNITVTYRIEPPLIRVKADFKPLKKKGLQKIFLLNEQGTRAFRKYCDSDGTVLFDKHIGAWENVEADWACISNKSDKVGFRLWKVKDATLRRGREFLEGTLDWVGLDYEVGPEKACFEYDIEIIGSLKKR